MPAPFPIGPTHAGGLPEPRVLVLDPTAEGGAVLGALLEGTGMVVETAHSIEEARALLLGIPFHALVIRPGSAAACDAVVRGLGAEDQGLDAVWVVEDPAQAAAAAAAGVAPERVVPLSNGRRLVEATQGVAERRLLREIAGLFQEVDRLAREPADDVIDRVFQEALEVIRADQGSLMLLEPAGHLRVVAQKGLSGSIRQASLPVGERIAGRVATLGEPRVIVGSVEAYPEFQGVSARPEIGSSLVFPLLVNRRVIGVLNLARRPGAAAFSPRDIPRASLFLSHVAMMLDNRVLRERLAEIETSRAQTIRREKLHAVETLVAGLSHEMNNPLTSIIGFVQLMLEGESAVLDRQSLEIVLSEAQRCREVVASLMRYARTRGIGTTRGHAPIAVGDLVKEVVAGRAREAAKHGIEVRTTVAPGLPAIRADATALRQALTNLLANAEQAVVERPEGERRIHIAARLNGDRVVLEVRDSGPGIPKELRLRVLEPFFTTRAPGVGTGLGLTLVSGVVEDLGGSLSVGDAPEGGALIALELPVENHGPAAAPS